MSERVVTLLSFEFRELLMMFSLSQLKNKKDIDANKSLKTCFVLMIFNFRVKHMFDAIKYHSDN
ncbi:hypothetical protein K220099C10_37540 [Bacteroides thetaiotaomicron]|jgi:hypothetical protein